MFKPKQGKLKAVKAELPYRKTISARSIVEDTQHAELVYGASKYDMILIAAYRCYELLKGAAPYITVPNGTVKPSVIALLEIEAGHIKPNYIRTQQAALALASKK